MTSTTKYPQQRRKRARDAAATARSLNVPPEEIPKWDVALESAAQEEYNRLKRPLTLEDFQDLAARYAFRFHDFMNTAAALVEAGRWRSTGYDESGNPVSADTLAGLYAYGRVDEAVARQYSVTWEPA